MRKITVKFSPDSLNYYESVLSELKEIKEKLTRIEEEIRK